tara:strand:+ start:98 stop:1084 length:987 start_codon:yes stop_codon:yes gene_type:complete
MAIAPVNKFINIAVPVAPGTQKIYEVPTGTSSLLLYAQVSNVAVGTTYPTVTFFQRRESRSTGNTRDIKVVKDAEIPPNDALILVDGRIVLEKTPLVIDRVFLQGTQVGVNTITNVAYDEPTGIATVTTMTDHGYNAAEQITMGGIYFTCSGSTGITTNVFPDPQQSYTIDSIPSTTTFAADLGGSKGYTHIYQPSIHQFKRASAQCIEVVDGSGSGHTAGSKFSVWFSEYNPSTGELVLKIGTNSLVNGNTIKIADDSLVFTCSMDNNYTEHSYPRSTDPASGSTLTLAVAAANESIRVNVGTTNAGGMVAPLQMEFIASILENSNV